MKKSGGVVSEKIVNELLSSITSGSIDHFETSNSVMTFLEYLELVEKYPALHLRGAAQYFADAIDYFESYPIDSGWGKMNRYTLFDAEFDQHEGRVMGHERVQEEIVRNIRNFVRAGKVDRLILLHGPNGSAKTSIVSALARAVEVYSRTSHGALYRFNWVFPLKKVSSGSMGFSSQHAEDYDSYAHLPLEEIELRIPCEHKDHPLLILSVEARTLLFRKIVENGSGDKNFPLPDILRKGELSFKNHKIFEALLKSYRGDLSKVLKHVQVERFYFSKRYRTGLTTVEPQLSVDAHARQMTVNHSLSSMPPALSHLSLIELGGPLVDANRGMLEYSDLLKRPIESWKYLLVATESAQFSLDVVSAFLDTLLLASSNESHLDAFRSYPDWQSFKGRIELIKVPYLLRFSDEIMIYENQIPRALAGRHISPHSLEIVARWAVLTRLEPPKCEEYENEIQEIVRAISPVEKMTIYDTGIAPDRLCRKDAQRLLKVVKKMQNEYQDDGNYEGLNGASPREIRKLLLSAAHNKDYDHLSPFSVLEEIRQFVKDKSSYSFLKREPVRGYRDALALLDVVEHQFYKDIHEEIGAAMGLIQADAHQKLLRRYVKHVSAWTKGEKVMDTSLNDYVSPDEELMMQVEKSLIARSENSADFRRSLISQIGAYRLDNPDEDEVDYQQLFGSYLKRLRDDYYLTQEKTVEHIRACYLNLCQGDKSELSDSDRARVELFRTNMLALGYNDSSTRQAVAHLVAFNARSMKEPSFCRKE